MGDAYKIYRKAGKKLNYPEYVEGVRWIGIGSPVYDPFSEVEDMFSMHVEVAGTGFYIKNKPYVVTCYHVISDTLGQIEIQNIKNQKKDELIDPKKEQLKILMVGCIQEVHRAAVVAVDVKHDLALLELQATDEVKKMEASKGFELAKSYPKIGERVGYCGYPRGNVVNTDSKHPTYAEGAVGSFPQKTKDINKIQISGSVIGGFSGSPIFSRYRQKIVYGMVYCGICVDAKDDSEIFYGVSYEHINNLLNCF